MPRILVIEDEPTIAMGLRDDLTIEGHAVDVATDGRAGEALALERRHDLIVLDLMLPEKDGLSVCRSLRAAGIPTPIIMLTAKSQDVDKVLGLELGADDYVTKPFSPRELTARISAVLRRMQPFPAGAPQVVHAGGLTIDIGRHEVTRNGRRIDLTALEFRLLRALVGHRGQVLTHDQIIEHVWGKDVFMTDRVIYTHVNNLRHKIETEPQAPTLIIGVRGVGYRFDG
jgi:two-component system, OmpR family, alkaline phosphatase synthesis response regulator PhoP